MTELSLLHYSRFSLSLHNPSRIWHSIKHLLEAARQVTVISLVPSRLGAKLHDFYSVTQAELEQTKT